MINPPDQFFRILCITEREHFFGAAVDSTWRRSGLVRWLFKPYGDAEIKNLADSSELVIVDCTTDQIRNASQLKGKISPSDAWFVAFSGNPRSPLAFPKAKVLSEEEFRRAVDSLPVPTQAHEVTWPDGDPDIKLAKNELEEPLKLILQKYFPFPKRSFHVHKVLGGWSGTPLVRISIENQVKEYFLKFFDDRQDFIQEWDNHASAVEWLGTRAVPVQPIPKVEESGEAQARVFPAEASTRGGARNLYPICYHSAHVTATLKELYRIRQDGEIKEAYDKVLDVIGREDNFSESTILPLTAMVDFEPSKPRRPSGQTILGSLRSLVYKSFIRAAEVELRPYVQICLGDTKSALLLKALDEFIGEDQRWVAEQAELTEGNIHGDANARNFLFDRSKPKPDGLQFIDCGCHHKRGPLVFDLAQMESDLKIILLGTEAGAPEYGDIDTGQLKTWISQEAIALSSFAAFKQAPNTTPSTWRAYQVIDRIRSRAADISQKDIDGRVYFFHLLYWTLRKLRHTNFPHVKRILALYSACRICQNMSAWHRR